MNKLTVELNIDCPDGDYKAGEKGFIDGYMFHTVLRTPMACVVIEDRVVCAPLYYLTILDH